MDQTENQNVEEQVTEPVEETPVETTGEEEVADVSNEADDQKKNEPETTEEQTAESVQDSGTPSPEGFQKGDSVTINNPNVAQSFGSDKAEFVSYLDGNVEALIKVNGEEKVVGVEVLA